MLKKTASEQLYELPADSFKARLNCPYCHLCGEITGQVYLPNFLNYPIGKVTVDKSVQKNFNLRRCPQCKLLYKDLAITREAQTQIYKQSNNLYSYKTSNKYVLRKIRVIKEMVSGEKPHLLDMGCHTGDFLKLAQSAGFTTSGIDYSETAYANRESFIDKDFYNDFIEEVKFPANSFDVITAWDVFEHLYDIDIALRKIHDALKPGGYLFIETGNAACFPAKLKSTNYWGYTSSLTHFNFFDNLSTKYILGDAGFNIVSIDKVYHKGIANLNSIHFTNQLLTSFSLFISPTVYKYITKSLGKSGSGIGFLWKDHIFITAQKPRLMCF